MKKNVSTLKAPFEIVWKKNDCSTTFRNSILSEYLKEIIQVCPSMIHAIDRALIPCIHGIVSLPTAWSQMALKFVVSENDSKISSLSAVNISELIDKYMHLLHLLLCVVMMDIYIIFLPPQSRWRDSRQNCYCWHRSASQCRQCCSSYLLCHCSARTWYSWGPTSPNELPWWTWLHASWACCRKPLPTTQAVQQNRLRCWKKRIKSFQSVMRKDSSSSANIT